MAHCRALRAISFAALVLGATPAGAAAQLPSTSQVQQLLRQNPQLGDLIRQRIAQSGMTPDQIRARLQAAGYPDSLLDAYLGAGTGGTIANAQEVAALQALGLPPLSPEGRVPLDTGLIAAAPAGPPPESLAVGNYVFGVDVFRRSRTQFLPLLAGPVPPDYRLGAGDQLVLILTGDVERSYALPVTREGFVVIPRVGQVFVNNLTLDQLHELLYERLGAVFSGVKRQPPTTHFDVAVANVRANQVYVIGEVVQPGAYQISALGTALTALYAAGGVTDRANLRHIEVRRLDRVVDTLDLYDYLLKGDSRGDVRLESGDVVFVPVHGVRVQATGSVTRPAIYELKPSETLPDLLRAAGGFRPNAALDRVTVYRFLPPAARSPAAPARTVLDVALGPAARQAAAGDDPAVAVDGVLVPSVPLEDGDSLVVDSVPSLYADYYVGIAGMVHKPGAYPWHEGMTLRDLLLLARGPLVGADLRQAEIARMPADRSRGQLASTIRVPLDSSYLSNRDASGRYFGPPGVAFPASGAPEVPLRPYDNVLILKQPEFDFQRTVTVVGQVRYPGVYSLRTKNDRLADILRRAGGLTDQAYSDGIRFVRQVDNVGRINVDLPRALKDTTSRYNVVLQPGDSIEIPEYQPSVKVSGAVNSPGSVLWQRGHSLDYYLGAAGGFTTKADKGHVSVRYANGEVRSRHQWLFVMDDPKPGPGSEVFVPTKEATQATNWVSIASAVTGILSSTLAILVLAKQL
jgi:polysaccharide biosynthesis/export protein